MSKVIGIDLGTTNSVVAFLENGRPVVLQNTEGHKTTPSMVHYSDGEEVIVGDLARRQRITDPGRVLYSIKRFMGCRFEESPEKMDGINYNIEPDSEEMAAVRIGARLLRPEEVSAEILIKMVETAEAYLGEEVGNAVITVPAHFNDSQRQATKKAAELAGLNCLRIINEPTAAALAYGLNKEKRQKVAVFDFGGGTFDISILDIDGDIFEVKATGGDNLLGGDNINHLLVEWMADLIREETGVDPRADLQAKQRIAETAEKVKCELSSMQKTLISLPFIVADESGPKHFSREISRDELNELIKPLLERLAPPCEQAMSDAGIGPDELDAVILVGGSTRIPAVRKLVEALFNKKPNTSMNPDEAVACGAAIQSAILSGHLQELLLLDVTPLSLGIELAGNVFSPLIPRNSNIPVTISKKFTTVVDNQSAVRVHVLQGERKIATENRSLAVFSLEGIPSAPKEIPEIEVQFHIDANGILTVSAMDLTSGVNQEVLVESYTAIATEEDAEDVLLDAEGHADEDRLHLRFASIRRRVNEMENILKSYKQKGNPLSEEQELQAREAFFRLEVAMARSDAEAVNDAERQAKTVFMEITSLMALRATDDTKSDFLKADFKPQPLESADAEESPEPSDSSPGR